MADNQNKNQNQNKGQVSQKPQRQNEQENQGNRQQSGNRGQGGMNNNLDKDIGNENRQVQKDLDTDETDQDEQGEITQRSPRQGEDQSRR
ncbi:MAG TPA: hypothetical protein VLT45_06495 [Kofleriaceae bacterium]|nr:hypothetical protein [Kofleriaceae bacterium]